MRIVLLSFLRRISANGLRQIAASLLQSGHVPILIFADSIQITSRHAVHALAQSVTRLHPDLVGVNVYTNHLRLAVELTCALRGLSNCPIVWGGPHPTAVPDKCIKSADYLCVGEGELSLAQLADALELSQQEPELEGIWYWNNPCSRRPNFAICDNLDDLPFSAWEGLDQYVWTECRLKRVEGEDIPNLLDFKYDIMTSRGCPFSCSYCYNSQLWKTIRSGSTDSEFLRRRSIDHVIRELEKAIRVFPQFQYVNFWDDCFVMDADYLKAFCSEYRIRIGLPFYCLSRFEFLTDDTIEILCGAGLAAIQIGVQTVGQKTLRLYQRRLPQYSEVVRVSRALKAFDVHTIYDVILNNPFESVHEVAETVQFFFKLPSPFVINGWNLTFLPGTDLETKAIAEGYISPTASNALSQLMFSNINSPIIFPFHNQLPNGSYKCQYIQENKHYLNVLLAMFGAWPKWFVSLLFYGRGIISLNVLNWLWRNDVAVGRPLRRLDTRRAQVEGIFDLVGAGQRELAMRIAFTLKDNRNVEEEVIQGCDTAIQLASESAKHFNYTKA